MWSKRLVELVRNIFNTRSVLIKVAIILLFMSLTTTLISWVGITKIRDMNQVAKDIYSSNTQVVHPLAVTIYNLYNAKELATKAFLYNDSSAISGLSVTFNEIQGQMGNFQVFLKDKKLAGQVETNWKKYFNAKENFLNALKNRGPELSFYYRQLQDESQTLTENIFDLFKKYRIEGSNAYIKGNKINESVLWLQIWITIIGVTLGIILSIIVANSIIQPLQQLRKTTDRLAKGDLWARVSINSGDEIGAVGQAFNRAVDELRVMVTDAAENAKNINTAATDLFKVTDATSRSLEDLNKLVEQMSNGAAVQTKTVESAIKTVQKATEGADLVTNATFDINQTCKEVSVAAERGGDATVEMIATIDNFVNRVNQIDRMVRDLADDSKQIHDLIDVINDIAERTTLLSLNASIEAARAGEQGKGFAVVASNIRLLATQARESVEHIHDVTNQILDKTYQVVATVEQGTNEVEKGHSTLIETIKLFKELVGRIDQITSNISQIAKTASQMSESNAAVIAEITKVSEISQSNLTAVKEVSATFLKQYSATMTVTDAARDLQFLAGQLSAAADKFKV